MRRLSLRGNETNWAVLVLSLKGEEQAKQTNLAKVLSNHSGILAEDIYVPLIKSNGEVVFLLEGYVFVKTGYPSSYYFDLVRTAHIDFMCSEFNQETGLFSKGVITDFELKKMVAKANSLGGTYKVGSEVKVKDGHFKGLEGEVVEVFEKEGVTYYCLFIKLRSVEMILKLNSFSICGV
jgi:transcription antitermination factor NusG